MNTPERSRVATHDDKGEAQRAKARDSLFLMGRMTLSDEKAPRDVRIRNLSEGGLMVEIERPVAVAATVSLAIRGIGEVAGKVAWCAEGRIGVALDRQIDPKLARKPVGRGAPAPGYGKPRYR